MSPAPPPSPPSLAEKMLQASASIVISARQLNLGELSYDEASLPTLDKLIAGLRVALKGMPESERQAKAMQLAWTAGAYVGEVICRSRNGFWCEHVPGVPDNIPAVDTGKSFALTIPAMYGLLTDGGTQLGEKTAASPNEYYRELIRLQKEWLGSRIQGSGTLGQLALDMSDDQSLANQLINALGTALLTASLKWGLHLDFSETSLEGLDSLLQQLHGFFEDGMGVRPTDEHVANMAMLWGVYYGEVIRRNRGGQWSYRTFPDGKRALQIGSAEQGILPLSRVEKQIRNGAEFSVRTFYHFTAGIVAPAGGSAPPPSAQMLSFANGVCEIALELMPTDGALPPFLAFAKDGNPNVEMFVSMTNEKAVRMGRKRAAEQPAEVQFVAVVYDGYMSHQNERKKDAILVEAHQRGLPAGFVFGQCYTRQTDGKVTKLGELEYISHCAAYLGSS